ncbi:MAG TPA: FtsX-like permease family protein [Candidatus Acidoferrales bacterium]|nr:FtsX-like permease family protein [Candidatus Acidoferrales bacterium]
MKAHDLVELAGRNLRESGFRNSLTTVGIAVGVAALVAMLSLGAGLQGLVTSRFDRSGLFNTIGVFTARDMRAMERSERRTGILETKVRPLDGAARKDIGALPDVIEVYPEIRLLTDVSYAGRTLFTSVSGLPPSARQNEAFEKMHGHFFTSADAPEAILHVDFARDLLAPGTAAGDTFSLPAGAREGGAGAAPEATDAQLNSLIGKELILRYGERVPAAAPAEAQTAGSRGGRGNPAGSASAGESGNGGGDSTAGDSAGDTVSFSVVRREEPLRIVGIIDTEPYAGITASSAARVFVPVGLAEKLHPAMASNLRDIMQSRPSGSENYSALIVRVDDPARVEPTQEALKKMGFRTFSLLDATKSLRRVFVILDLFLAIFGSVALVVASLGIVNTLVMSVLERRREIGVLKALGASDADVKRLFFVEAGVMGVAGGALGVLLGWLIGRAINLGTNMYLSRQELPHETIILFPLWLIGGAVAFAVVVSLLSGIYPAARAARLDPVQVLRYE